MDEGDLRDLFNTHETASPKPPPHEIRAWVDDLLGLLFPGLAGRTIDRFEALRRYWAEIHARLMGLMKPLGDALPESPTTHADALARDLPGLRRALLQDAQAICAGDPAATDTAEVIRTYPGFYAIGVYRIAHQLHVQGVPVLPRVLTEHAHARTGIDIHPGATIGPRFCIDHGTGIVVGETTEIGADVKLYQGVTLGALSVEKEMARTKRHPTVEDGVVIYAGATILGGRTVVGRGSVIGGSVWLLHSVPPGSRVYHSPETVVEEKRAEEGPAA